MALWNQGVKEKYLTPVEREILLCLLFTDKKQKLLNYKHRNNNNNSVWYKQKWSKGTVLEKNGKKICWDFEFTMRKTTSARRPDVMIENDEEKKLWIPRGYGVP